MSNDTQRGLFLHRLDAAFANVAPETFLESLYFPGSQAPNRGEGDNMLEDAVARGRDAFGPDCAVCVSVIDMRGEPGTQRPAFAVRCPACAGELSGPSSLARRCSNEHPGSEVCNPELTYLALRLSAAQADLGRYVQSLIERLDLSDSEPRCSAIFEAENAVIAASGTLTRAAWALTAVLDLVAGPLGEPTGTAAPASQAGHEPTRDLSGR